MLLNKPPNSRGKEWLKGSNNWRNKSRLLEFNKLIVNCKRDLSKMLTNWERLIRILKLYVLPIKETYKWLKNKISCNNNIKSKHYLRNLTEEKWLGNNRLNRQKSNNKSKSWMKEMRFLLYKWSLRKRNKMIKSLWLSMKNKC